jgi:hypothetical protein
MIERLQLLVTADLCWHEKIPSALLSLHLVRLSCSRPRGQGQHVCGNSCCRSAKATHMVDLSHLKLSVSCPVGGQACDLQKCLFNWSCSQPVEAQACVVGLNIMFDLTVCGPCNSLWHIKQPGPYFVGGIRDMTAAELTCDVKAVHNHNRQHTPVAASTDFGFS